MSDNTTGSLWKIYLLAGVSFLLGLLQFIFNGILDQIAHSAGVSISTAGQLMTAFSLGSALGTPIVIFLAARVNRKKLLLMALVLIVLSAISTATLPGFSLLILSRVVFGIGFGVYGVSSLAIASDLAPEGYRARSLSTLATGAGLALVLGVPTARLITAIIGWRIIFGAIGVLLLPILFILSRIIPSPRDASSATAGHQWVLLKKPKIILALCVTLFMFISYSAISTYTVPYVSSLTRLSNKTISLILLFLGIASVFGSKLGGVWADHAGAGHALTGSLLIQAGAHVLLLLLPKTIWLAVPVIFILTAAAWTAGPTLAINLILRSPAANGILLSTNNSFLQMGLAVGAALGGMGIKFYSIDSIVWIGTAAILISTILGQFAFTNRILDKHLAMDPSSDAIPEE